MMRHSMRSRRWLEPLRPPSTQSLGMASVTWEASAPPPMFGGKDLTLKKGRLHHVK